MGDDWRPRSHILHTKSTTSSPAGPYEEVEKLLIANSTHYFTNPGITRLPSGEFVLMTAGGPCGSTSPDASKCPKDPERPYGICLSRSSSVNGPWSTTCSLMSDITNCTDAGRCLGSSPTLWPAQDGKVYLATGTDSSNAGAFVATDSSLQSWLPVSKNCSLPVQSNGLCQEGAWWFNPNPNPNRFYIEGVRFYQTADRNWHWINHPVVARRQRAAGNRSGVKKFPAQLWRSRLQQQR